MNSNNNRKYITSTGLLLKTLAAEDLIVPPNSSNNNLYVSNQQQLQQQTIPPPPPQIGVQSFQTAFYGNQISQQQMMHHHHHQSFNPFQQPNNNLSNQSNYLINSVQVNTLQQQQQQSHHRNTNYSGSDVMIMPNSNSNQLQQRWPQKNQNKHHQPKSYQSHTTKQQHQHQQQQQQQQQNAATASSNKKNSSINTNQISSSNTQTATTNINELPETFGLPSNSTSQTNYKSVSSSNLNNNNNNSKIDILLDDTANSTASPSNNQIDQNTPIGIDKQQLSDSAVSSTADIEIISENYPFTNKSLSSSATDDLFKIHLSKNYNYNLNSELKRSNNNNSTNKKYQSNFASNFLFINQLANQTGYFENKLKRFKPYSANIKSKDIESFFNKYDQSEDEECSDQENKTENDNNLKENETVSNKNKKLKTHQVIVIDDTHDEIHKPWITPELINLIKHRNLLQSKINEKNLIKETNGSRGEIELNGADAELLKKFKNLRNKVTKLVKKARKDYLANYIKENKSTLNANSNVTESVLTDNNNKNSNLASSQTVNEDSSSQKQQQANNNNNNNLSTKATEISINDKQQNELSNTLNESTTSTQSKKNVTNVISQLTSTETTGGFLKNQQNLIMSLYNSYYNQYIQNYTQQQQKAQEIAQKASKNASNDKASTNSKEAAAATSNTGESSYESLQKQAAYYAQQQAAVQQQLEKTLTQSATQLMQEITDLAVKNTQNQSQASTLPPPPPTGSSATPFIQFNQYQHQHHLSNQMQMLAHPNGMKHSLGQSISASNLQNLQSMMMQHQPAMISASMGQPIAQPQLSGPVNLFYQQAQTQK